MELTNQVNEDLELYHLWIGIEHLVVLFEEMTQEERVELKLVVGLHAASQIKSGQLIIQTL